MPLPITFGPLAGPIPTSNLDTNFAAVGAMGVLSCTAAGGNALTLSPLGQQTIPLAYSNGQRFQFIAALTNTGAMTANVAALGIKPIFKDTTLGPVICTGGEVTAANAYQLWFDAALNAGLGGFHLVAAGGTGGGGGSSSNVGPWAFLQLQTTSGSSVQFTGLISATYEMYQLQIDGMVVGTSGATLGVQVSTNNGVTWITTGYNWVTISAKAGDASAGVDSNSNDSSFNLFPSAAGLSSGLPTSAEVMIYGVSSASGQTQVTFNAAANRATNNVYTVQGAGKITNTAAVNAVQLISTTGVISVGNVILYGLATTNTSSSGGGGGVTTAGVVADARNFVASFNTTTKLTITATEAIAKLAPGSSAFLGVNLSFTLNFATTGVNGLDTGSVAASKFYGIYFIYNPTANTWGTLASLNTTTPSLPAGYTAYALMGVVPTDGSAHIVAGFSQFGRGCVFQPISIFSGHNAVASLTTQSLSAAVPPIGKTVNGIIGTTQSGGVNTGVVVASDANYTDFRSGTNSFQASFSSAYPGSIVSAFTFYGVQMTTAQTIFWAAEGNNGLSMLVTGYTI